MVACLRQSIRKVRPYLKRNTGRVLRSILEPVGIDWLSKPFPGHEALAPYFDFDNGFFVAVGANDGYFQDPTYYLEKIRRWTGILIEPLPLYQKCARNRRHSTVLNLACVPDDFPDRQVTLIDSNAMSFVKNGIPNEVEWIAEWEQISDRKHREIVVPAKTLTEVLDTVFGTRPPRPIDLLCIDVEGYELQVLRGLDLERYTPQSILLESHSKELLEEIRHLLLPFFPVVDSITSIDFLFRRR